jgi:HYR domain/Secretion system C-terminal sorting domain
MNNKSYLATVRYWALILIGIFTMTLSFATNPLVPNEIDDPCRHDREAPHISCSKDIYVYVDCDEKCAKVKFDEPYAKDNCDPYPKVWCDYKSGYCFPIGTTEVWCWAKDKSGNESKTYFKVIVKEKPDKEPPYIYCQKDIYAYVECDEKCAKVNFDEPKAKDNCDHYPKVWCEYQSGYCFPVGKTEVWCWAKDKWGNESKCYFNVHVSEKPDKEPPYIYCQKDIYAYVDCGEKCAKVNFDEPKAKDNCDPYPKVWCEYQSGYCFPVGKTEVWCWAKDKWGNESKCYFNVHVSERPDKTPPVIKNCPSEVTAYVDCGLSCVRLFCWDGPIATDNCDPKPKLWCEINGKAFDNWYCFPLGKTSVTCYAQDRDGNKSYCTYTINVKYKDDYTPPVIICPKDFMVSLSDEETKLNKMCRKVTLPTVKVSDNCDPNPKVECTVYDGSKEVVIDDKFCFMMGKTRIRCTATDKGGNKSTCIFWITVMGYGDLMKAVDENTSTTALVNKDNKGVEKTDSENDERLSQKTLNLLPSQKLLHKEVTIYPNPTSTFINIELSQYEGKKAAVQVLNSVGQQVYNTTLQSVSDQSYRIDMQEYPMGMYIIKVTIDGVESMAKKVVKQ